MAHFRAMQAARAVGIAVRITAPHRRILFKDVPEWMTLSDILCLVYGGAVDRAWKVSETEYIVQFCDDKACTNYYDAHSSGIRVGDQGNHFIAIEKPEGTERAPFDLVEKMVAGHSRVIRITGITTNKTLQDLRNVAAEYEVDHIMWRDEVTKVKNTSTHARENSSLIQYLGWRGIRLLRQHDACRGLQEDSRGRLYLGHLPV